METYHGHVRTPQDAIVLFEACRLGLLPRVQRRLSEKERSQIKSGSVFVWDEREAGMRRWTDGKSWSASRVSGSFLTYREMEGKRGSNGFQPGAAAAAAAARSKSSGPKSSGGSNAGDSDEGDEGPDGYRYKPDGLMKQSFSITTQDGRHLHLISYYNRSHMPPLKSPATDPQLRNISPPKGMYPENTVNEPTTMTPIGRPPIPASPYPGHGPPGLVVAYHAWPPGYPPPPGAIAYPAPAWPPSPSATPPHHYAYPHPAYAHSPYPQPHLPQFPHGQHPLDRGPPTPQTSLPPPQVATNGHTPPSGWPPARSPGIPGYHGPSPSLHAAYTASQAPSAGATLAPVPNGYQAKPPSPPATANATSKPFSEPPPLKDIPTTNAGNGATKIIPSITALINGPLEAREQAQTPNRSGSKSPGRVIKDVPNAMTATVTQRDKGDLKKLDSQLLKS
jgi:hypothetical protein